MDHNLPKDLDDIYGAGAEDAVSESSAAEVSWPYDGSEVEHTLTGQIGVAGQKRYRRGTEFVLVDWGLHELWTKTIYLKEVDS